MSIFLILSKQQESSVAAAVQRAFPNDHMQLNDTQWLVAAKGTARDVSDKLGGSKGELGRVMVAGIDTYFGWYPKDVWDWIKARWEATTVG